MDNRQLINEETKQKWQPLVEHPELDPIKDNYRKTCTTVLLENQEKFLLETGAPANSGFGNTNSNGMNAASTQVGGLDAFDPVLISLVRRSMPNLIAYDVAGVQPMTGPTGLIFAMKSNYTDDNTTDDNPRAGEALYFEADSAYSGTGSQDGMDDIFAMDVQGGPTGSNFDRGVGMTTAAAEALGAAGGTDFAEMAFSIEKTAVEAKTRALKAEYTTELAQDLRAVHGLDAETELANILSTEILTEINRELVRTIYRVARLGAQQSDLENVNADGTTDSTAGLDGVGGGGIYDLNADADGRWSAEKFRGLVYQIERECNEIAKSTRRGKGNFVLVSADVASALSMSGVLDFSPAFNPGLAVDDTGNTFIGTLSGGRVKCYIDPYAATNSNFCCVGYKGASPYDAGLFYCPYVPLQMVRAVGENTFQPKIGFKTRYGMVSNPFVTTAVGGTTPDAMTLTPRVNQYYRIFRIDNLHGNGS
tara:strand:- start:5263 stop:6696 length:1434 start_codon:yes stop_codon:yes gene_type:complete